VRINQAVAAAYQDRTFRSFADAAHDAIYRFEVWPRRRTDYVNPAIATISGRRPEDFYADPLLNVTAVHPDDRHLAEEPYLAGDGPAAEQVVMRWVHPSGRVVWAEHRRVFIRDEGGRILAFEGDARDVTAAREAERRLAASEMLFRLLAENARDLVYRYVLAPALCAEYVSPAALRVTGYPPEAFYRDPQFPFKAIHPHDRSIAERMRDDPSAYDRPIVLRWYRPDGTLVWVEHHNRPVRAPDGTVIAIEGIARDITDSLAIQDRLRASQEQLRRLAGRLQAQREEDRAFIARELHDDVGQTFTSLKLELSQSARTLVRHAVPLPVIDQLQALMGIVDVGAERVRRLASELRPAALDHLGLGAALEFEAVAIRRRTGLRIRISGGDVPSGLDIEQDTAIFRIVQEALTNTIRHANASAVAIRLFHRRGDFIVRVIDNGRGARDEQLADPNAFGILGMRERAQLIGGRLIFTGKSGRGTKVSLIVPTRANGSSR
jgi:PAS domain S-box-containing protein